MQKTQDQVLRQQLIDRLMKTGMGEAKAREAIKNLLSVYNLALDRNELLREVEELAILYEEDSLIERLAGKSHIA